LDTKTLSAGLLPAFGSFIRSCSTMEEFSFLSYALFTVGLGFFNSANCNPLAIKMGSPTGAHRLTLAGEINSFGTTIGAILLGIALFGMGMIKKHPFFRRYKTTIYNFRDCFYCSCHFIMIF
jgi:FHS family L-fucose permease-like MFS transporter